MECLETKRNDVPELNRHEISPEINETKPNMTNDKAKIDEHFKNMTWIPPIKSRVMKINRQIISMTFSTEKKISKRFTELSFYIHLELPLLYLLCLTMHTFPIH